MALFLYSLVVMSLQGSLETAMRGDDRENGERAVGVVRSPLGVE